MPFVVCLGWICVGSMANLWRIYLVAPVATSCPYSTVITMVLNRTCDTKNRKYSVESTYDNIHAKSLNIGK
jgi:hypothetical protein